MNTPISQQYCVNNQWNPSLFQHVATYGMSPEVQGIASYTDNFANPTFFAYPSPPPYMAMPQECPLSQQQTSNYSRPQSFSMGNYMMNPTEVLPYYISSNEHLPYSHESNNYVQLADISPPSMAHISSRSFSLPY